MLMRTQLFTRTLRKIALKRLQRAASRSPRPPQASDVARSFTLRNILHSILAAAGLFALRLKW